MEHPTLGASALHRHSSSMLQCPYRATQRVLVSRAECDWYSRSRAVVPCSPSSSRSARGWGVPREDGAFPWALRAGAIPASLHHVHHTSSCLPVARRILLHIPHHERNVTGRDGINSTRHTALAPHSYQLLIRKCALYAHVSCSYVSRLRPRDS